MRKSTLIFKHNNSTPSHIQKWSHTWFTYLKHTKILLWLWNDCYRLITELNEASLNFETSWMTGDGELGSRRGASGLSYLKAPTIKKEALKHGLDWTREAAFTALNNQKLRREKHTNTPYFIHAVWSISNLRKKIMTSLCCLSVAWIR